MSSIQMSSSQLPSLQLPMSAQVSYTLRLTNYSLAFCLLVLLVNTVLFCKEHNGCENIPNRSKLGATPKMAIMNTELTFLTLMTAHAPLSLLQQQFKGAHVSSVRLYISFLMPILVAICLTYDTKRFTKTHQFFVYIIFGAQISVVVNSYYPIVVAVLVACLVQYLKAKALRDAPPKPPLQPQPTKNYSAEMRTAFKFFFGNLIGLFFGLWVFFPMLYIMYGNEYYARLS